MAFERLQESNEKHQCVIVQTNKQFFLWSSRNRCSRQPLKCGVKQSWLEMGSPRRSASFPPDRGLFAVNVMEILAQPDIYIVNIIIDCKA